jgi:hypothetical protein
MASTPAASAATATTPIVEVFGCAADLRTAVRTLGPRYTVVASGDGYAVLQAKA